MTDTRLKSKGFTLIELMIVIAIIGILAAAAVPQYAQYTKKAKFSEVVSRTAEYKSAVHLCVQELNTLTGCSHGANGVPGEITTASGYLESLNVVNGLITATATSNLDSRQYVLSANYDPAANRILWTAGGSCFAANMCND